MIYWFIHYGFASNEIGQGEAFTIMPSKRKDFSIRESVEYIRKELREQYEPRGETINTERSMLSITIRFFKHVRKETCDDFQEYLNSSE